MSQCKTKPTITCNQLRIRSACTCMQSDLESSLVACAFNSLRAILKGITENPYLTGWMYWLIRVFDGHTGLVVGFVVHWLIYMYIIEVAAALLVTVVN